MIGSVFRWLIAPAGLLTAFAIVETHVEGRLLVVLVSYLSGSAMGLYFGLLLLKRRQS
jgi:hypothetical protein